MLLQLISDPFGLVAVVIGLLTAITVHEAAHAFVADQLGDPTARDAGRISLNPLAHLDPLGTALLLFAGIGWGKPVPVNPLAFQRPTLDELLVALAGPATNFLLAAGLGLGLRIQGLPAVISSIGITVLQINLLLMLFNLLPVPPLDGSKVLQVILGQEAFARLQQASLFLIVGLLIVLRSTGLGDWLSVTVMTLTRFLLGG